MRALLHIQVPHVVLIGGPGLQRLEQTLVAGVLLGELQAALHALDPCQQLEPTGERWQTVTSQQIHTSHTVD